MSNLICFPCSWHLLHRCYQSTDMCCIVGTMQQFLTNNSIEAWIGIISVQLWEKPSIGPRTVAENLADIMSLHRETLYYPARVWLHFSSLVRNSSADILVVYWSSWHCSMRSATSCGAIPGTPILLLRLHISGCSHVHTCRQTERLFMLSLSGNVMMCNLDCPLQWSQAWLFTQFETTTAQSCLDVIFRFVLSPGLIVLWKSLIPANTIDKRREYACHQLWSKLLGHCSSKRSRQCLLRACESSSAFSCPQDSLSDSWWNGNSVARLLLKVFTSVAMLVACASHEVLHCVKSS